MQKMFKLCQNYMSFLTDVKVRHHFFPRGQVRQQFCILGTLLGGYAAIIGCSGNTSSGGSPVQSEETKDQIEVVSTFTPITSFTKAIAGDRAKVTQLIPHNVSPHDYQARPEEVVRLQKADVVIENGLEFEPFLESMIEASENQDVMVIDSSEGIAVADWEEGAHEGHADHEDHAEEKEHDDHDHEDEHGHKDEEHSKEKEATQKAEKREEHQHGGHDPHIWLDPKRAIQQVENIRDGLIKADPEGKEVYQANAQAYIGQLKALDTDISNQLQSYQGKTFVTYHDFAAYFAQSYGLTAEFLVGVPSENASPKDVTRVINAVEESNLKTLLTEPQAINDPFSALANDLQISVSEFDPMGTSPTAEIQADSYISTMRNNLKNISAAFSAQSQQSFWFQPSFRTSVKSGLAVIPNPLFNSTVSPQP